MLAPVDRARKQFEPCRNPNQFLYWRSRRDLPTGRWSRPFHRGTSPRQVLTKDIGAQELLGCSRRIGSAQKIASFRPSPVGEHASFRYAPLRVLPPVLHCWGRVENVQELRCDAHHCIMGLGVSGPPMAGLCAPLSTLRRNPRGQLRMTRGRCGSLLLHRKRLALSTPCRSPGASQI